jgi:hypothetical protein
MVTYSECIQQHVPLGCDVCNGAGPSKALDPQRRGQGGIPDELRDQIQNHAAKWHILDEQSGLNGAGTLVLMSLRLAHAATPNESLHLRVSWDTRFRCRIVDSRDVVFADLPGVVS